MTVSREKKIDVFIIVFIVLLGLNFLGIFLLGKGQEALSLARSRLSWEDKLKKEGLDTGFFKDVTLIDKALPNQQGVIEFISSINKSESQFEKLSLNFETDEPKKDEYKYLPFVLEISGDSVRVTEFLKKLLKAPFVLEITSLEIKQKEGSANQADAVVKANLYVSEVFD